MSRKKDKLFSQVIYEYRKRKGLTQTFLSNLLHVSQGQYCRWEKGEFVPTKLRQLDIAHRLKIRLPGYCEIPGCLLEGKRSYLISVCVLPETLHNDPRFKLLLCDKHAGLRNEMGTDVFCESFKISEKLQRARKILKNEHRQNI